jgi:hypothetical protein
VIAGELRMRVHCGAHGVRAVECLSSRPQVAGLLLAGLEPAAAAERMRLVYSVCGHGQSTTCAAACEAAAGATPDAALTRRRDRALATELALEHLWHFLMELPRSAGHAPAAQAMGAARQAPGAATLEAVAREQVFGMAPAEFAAFARCDDLRRWSREGASFCAGHLARRLGDGTTLGASTVALMPEGGLQLREAVFAGLERGGDFAAQPAWTDGEARETGALARMAWRAPVGEAIARWGRGVAARHAARLLELAEVIQELADDRPRERHGALAGPVAGVGYAWAETARGLLAHRAQLEAGRIARYDVVAPTEWNFHPRGAFVAGARAIRARDARRVHADACAVAASLDPCVAWRVEVSEELAHA